MGPTLDPDDVVIDQHCRPGSGACAQYMILPPPGEMQHIEQNAAGRAANQNAENTSEAHSDVHANQNVAAPNKLPKARQQHEEQGDDKLPQFQIFRGDKFSDTHSGETWELKL